MKKTILGLLLIVISHLSFSQTKKFEITGTLLSDIDKSPLESATIYLKKIKDSTLINYTISNQNGKFTLEDKTSAKAINLFISYIGFKTYQRKIELNKSNIDLGNIMISSDENMLDEIIIKSSAPIVVKKDTLEFNVKSFKTKKDRLSTTSSV